jgi:L-ascorbate metabolism protein UlaG (beta-lactamase superfamily)
LLGEVIMKLIKKHKWKSIALLVLITGVLMSQNACTTPLHSSATPETVITNSPQWRDGRFHNPLPPQMGSMTAMISKMWNNPNKHKTPDSTLSFLQRSATEFQGDAHPALQVTWMGHSSVLLEIEGKRVLTDPVWSNKASPVSFAGPGRFYAPPLALDSLPVLDVVIISHDHYDHLDKATILAIQDRVSLFAVPLGVGGHLEKWGVDPNKIQERDWWGSIAFEGLTLTATPARHFSGRSLSLSMSQNNTLWAGWSIAGKSHRVYYSGDTGMFPDFYEIGNRLGPFDLTLIESGAYDELWPDVHIGPEQAVQAHRMVRGKVMMPVHWGTFNLANHNWQEPAERILAAAAKAGISVYIPQPGESFLPKSLPQFSKWWPDLPWQNAEEMPVISNGLDSNLYEHLESIEANPNPAQTTISANAEVAL